MTCSRSVSGHISPFPLVSSAPLSSSCRSTPLQHPLCLWTLDFVPSDHPSVSVRLQCKTSCSRPAIIRLGRHFDSPVPILALGPNRRSGPVISAHCVYRLTCHFQTVSEAPPILQCAFCIQNEGFPGQANPLNCIHLPLSMSHVAAHYPVLFAGSMVAPLYWFSSKEETDRNHRYHIKNGHSFLGCTLFTPVLDQWCIYVSSRLAT